MMPALYEPSAARRVKKLSSIFLLEFLPGISYAEFKLTSKGKIKIGISVRLNTAVKPNTLVLLCRHRDI